MPVAVGNNTISPFVGLSVNPSTNLLNGARVDLSFPNIFNNSMSYAGGRPSLYDSTAYDIVSTVSNARDGESAATDSLTMDTSKTYSLTVYVRPTSPTVYRQTLYLYFRNAALNQNEYGVWDMNSGGGAALANSSNSPINPIQFVRQPLANGWYQMGLTFKVKNASGNTFRFGFEGSVAAPAGTVIARMAGVQLTEDNPAKLYYMPGGYARVSTPRYATADQEIPAFTSNARVLNPWIATGSSTFDPFIANGSGVVYPIINASSTATTFNPFIANSSARLINLARGTNTIPPFQQVAQMGYATLTATSSTIVAPFTQAQGTVPEFVEVGATVSGTAATARTVFLPTTIARKPGDMILVVAGMHSDGTTTGGIMPPNGYRTVGTSIGPSHLPGYRMILSVFAKYWSPGDTTAQVVYSFPSNYTAPAVWARALIVKNAGEFENVSADFRATNTFDSKKFNAQGRSRVALFFLQSSKALNQNGLGYSPPGGWFNAFNDTISTGSPPYRGLLDMRYLSAPSQDTHSTYLSDTDPVNSVSLIFTMTPVGAEASSTITAQGNSTIEPFRAVRDLFMTGNNTIDAFTQYGFANITPLKGDNTISPFTSNATTKVRVSAVSDPWTMEDFVQRGTVRVPIQANTNTQIPAFTSGIILTYANGNATSDAFTGTGSAFVTISANTNTLAPSFIANGLGGVEITATGDSTFERFLSGVMYVAVENEVGAFRSNAAGLSDVKNRLRGAQTITRFETGEAFMRNPTRPFATASSDSTIEPFTADIIRSFALGPNTTFERFTSNANGNVTTFAYGETTFEPFIQDAGNLNFSRTQSTFDAFISEMANAFVTVRTVNSVSSFNTFVTANTLTQAIAGLSGESTYDPFTQDMYVGYINTIRADYTMERFLSNGVALDPDPKPPQFGGIRIRGAFIPWRGIKIRSTGYRLP